MSTSSDALTVVYKVVGGTDIQLDLYPPHQLPAIGTAEVPAVIYFHGGALTVGDRRSWFPHWLHKRVTNLNIAFISVDYRLIPPSTGHDILEDIEDLFRFLGDDINDRLRHEWLAQSRLGHPFRIDKHALAVSGSSAGGLCAYLAAVHASPRPKAVLSLYGMGGDMVTPHYLCPKYVPFFRGREILDPKDFTQYLYPASTTLPAIADSPLAYHPSTYHIPGYPANPRMLLGRLYLQLGTFLDYYTGCHDPSLSVSLRKLLGANDQHVDAQSSVLQSIPEAHRRLFPQCNVDAGFPPTLLIHGSADTAVLVRESQNLHRLLQDICTRSEIVIIEGKEHSFDYEPTAEEEFGQQNGLFDRAAKFIEEALNVA
ncbi:alpha/beta-hydrolase [Trametes coccinea BRFM310]|uniref:Alpha/beta-hydrolase n=1 Tax=Trametes coccinea (strain BRFM310) TaxID=1353009 RepID=A0A1Y2J1L7_TRAC3|nr:alpha/beta-hydrolase [Trametes coccinea BRFM310]